MERRRELRMGWASALMRVQVARMLMPGRVWQISLESKGPGRWRVRMGRLS